MQSIKMQNIKKISVGTKNPVKIEAVKMAVQNYWPEAEIIGVDVPSGVKEQPTSDQEGIQGAITRAKQSLKEIDADLGIGLEGNVVETKYGLFLSGWVAAVDNNGKIGLGNSGMLLLPPQVAAEIRKGRELGPVMDEMTGQHNTKQNQGTSGILTHNVVTRVEGFKRGVIFALVRFINPDLFKE